MFWIFKGLLSELIKLKARINNCNYKLNMVEAVTLGKRTHKQVEESEHKRLLQSARDTTEKDAGEKQDANGDNNIYEVKGQLRYVKPYTHEFKAFAKRRWIGCKLLDVFNKEF